MKVFEFSYDCGSWSGGLAIVAANTSEEAQDILGEDWNYNRLLSDLTYNGIEPKIISMFTYIE
jgi:hypothetical protein